MTDNTMWIKRKTTDLAILDSQKKYRDTLANFSVAHIKRIKAMENTGKRIPPLSMLVIGKTGVGKTYVASQITKAAGVKLVIVDCSTLTKTGWKGINLDEILRSIVERKSNEISCIIWFDETDKMFQSSSEHDDNNPQTNILKLFDGTYSLKDDDNKIQTYDVSRVSFIFSGAFSGLDNIIRNKFTPKKSIGFAESTTSMVEEKDWLQYTTLEDIERYGMMAELCGRIGQIFVVDNPTEDDYRTLITSKDGGLISQYSSLFSEYGVSVNIAEPAVEYMTEKAKDSKYGIRALNPDVRSLLLSTIPALEKNKRINRVIIDYENNELLTRFKYGKKKFVTPEVPSTEKVIAEDINFCYYFDTNRRQHLHSLILSHYVTKNPDEYALLSSFLTCALIFMEYDVLKEERNFIYLTKIASTTDIIPEEKRGLFNHWSSFCRITKKGDFIPSELTSVRLEFNEAFDRLMELSDENTSELLTKAIRQIRLSWYNSLYLNTIFKTS